MFGTLMILSVACGPPARANTHLCSCVVGAGPVNVKVVVAEGLRKADAVFVGSVASVIDSATPLASRPSMVVHTRRVLLVLERGWKGALSDSLVVWTGNGAGDCGYPFKVGERYLVFAVSSGSAGFSTGVCTLTQPLSKAGRYIRALGDASIHRQRGSESMRP